MNLWNKISLRKVILFLKKAIITLYDTRTHACGNLIPVCSSCWTSAFKNIQGVTDAVLDASAYRFRWHLQLIVLQYIGERMADENKVSVRAGTKRIISSSLYSVNLCD